MVGDGRIIAIQQPHTYSRTQQMYREFAEVLEQYADHTVMLDVYGAREDPVPGVTGELVSDAFEDPAHVHYVARLAAGRRLHRDRRARRATTSSRSAAATCTRSSRRCSTRSPARRRDRVASPRTKQRSSSRMRRPTPLPPSADTVALCRGCGTAVEQADGADPLVEEDTPTDAEALTDSAGARSRRSSR